MSYTVAIISKTSWNPDGSPIIEADCGHSHRSLRAAERCLHRLSKYWADGTHNEWAHFGQILNDGSRLTGEEVADLDQIRFENLR